MDKKDEQQFRNWLEQLTDMDLYISTLILKAEMDKRSVKRMAEEIYKAT